MSSVKISNLPVAPQNWNLTDILPVVDSGNTQTSKQTFEYLFGNWSGQTINSSNQYFIAGTGTDANKVIINGSNRTVIVASESGEAQGSVDGFIGASREDGSGRALLQSTEACAFLATRGYQSIQNSAMSAQLASRDSNIYGIENTFIIGSQICDIVGNVYRGGIIASDSNTSLNNSTASVVMASRSSNVNMQGSQNGVVIGSETSNVYPVSNTGRNSGVYSSYSSEAKSKTFCGSIFNSFNCDLDDTNAGSGTRVGTIIGGYDSNIIPTKVAGLAYNQMILNCYGSNISGNVTYTNTIMSSDSSLISGGTNNTIVGSLNVSHNNLTGAVSIGVQSGNDALYNNTTHTDNLHTYKTESFDVIDAGDVTGSVTVNCTLGTIFTFNLIGDVDVNFTNPRTGQRFIFIVDNTTFNVTSMTVNGVGGTVFAKNGTVNPSSNAITKYTATYDGSRMFLDEELNFSAL